MGNICHICQETVRLWRVEEVVEPAGLVGDNIHHTCHVHLDILLSRLQAQGCKKFSITIIGGV